MKLKGDKTGRKGHLSVATEVLAQALCFVLFSIATLECILLKLHNSASASDFCTEENSNAKLIYLFAGF